MSGPRVLVVDDEPAIADLVSTALRYEGFEVATAGTGHDVAPLVESFRPELIVLDVMLPDVDGFEVQRRLRDGGRRVPVLFLTARDATEDKVRGLSIGGDDYVTKPFSLEELIARIRAILRRAQAGEPDGGRLRFEDLEMDEDAHEVWRAEDRIELTPTEFNLLAVPAVEPAPGPVEGPDPRSRMALRLRGRRFDRRDVHQLPPTEGRRERTAPDPHRARCGLHAPAAARLTMSLRARLLIVTVALVGAGLFVANVAVYHELRDFLLQRVDQQLVDAVRFAPGDGGGPGPGELPLSTYVGFCDDHGTNVGGRFLGGSGYSPPALPDGLPNSSSPGTTTIFTAPSTDGATTYRVLARGTAREPGTLVIAIPVGETFATLHRLLGVQLLVSLVVLLTVAALASWLVRIGLRPLEGIGTTAGAIAAGDLSRRVEPADERTEVGRLGLALNAMLAQIEAAFDQRRRSEERLRTFIADASHELRTPLTSIRGYAELFRRGADSRPEDLEKSMARIEAEAGRMGVLVDDLLLLARLDQGRPLERDPVDLTRVVGEAVDAARAIDPDRPVELEADGEVEVRGDELRLRQVLDNLLENARVHTPPKTPHPRARASGRRTMGCSPSTTRARDSTRRSRARSSSGSSEEIPPARVRRAAPDSVCRSSPRSCRRTAARSASWRPSRTRPARPSRSGSRSRPTRANRPRSSCPHRPARRGPSRRRR